MVNDYLKRVGYLVNLDSMRPCFDSSQSNDSVRNARLRREMDIYS